MYTLEGTVLIKYSLKFVRILIPVKSRSSLKLGHIGSKTNLLSQIVEKPCLHSRGHSFDLKFMKVCQNVNSYKI